MTRDFDPTSTQSYSSIHLSSSSLSSEILTHDPHIDIEGLEECYKVFVQMGKVNNVYNVITIIC